MSWWWAGAVGAARKKLDEGGASTITPKFQSVALILDSTSLVGTSLVDILPLNDTPGGPWKLYAVSTHPPKPSSSSQPDPIQYIHCGDFSDRTLTLEILSPLADVTHVFYVAEDANADAFRNVLDACLLSFPNLQHICLLSGRDCYTGGHDPPFHEDLRKTTKGCDLEDVLVEKVKGTNNTSWSVHRSSPLIFGYSVASCVNLIGSLCVYASVCKKLGLPLRWPGNEVQWEGYSDASDADLIAEHQIWASVDPYAKNEVFNCSNGDVFKWKHLWKILCEQFGVELAGYEGEHGRVKLEEFMKGKDEVWDEIVRENGLAATKLNEVGNWGFADEVLNGDVSRLHSMNRSKEHGFLGFRNSVYSLGSWIDKAKAFKIVP